MQDKSLICVVDDDEEMRKSLDTFFRSAGIDIETFQTAETLLSWSGLHNMECLITDLHLPGMDGLILRRALADRGHDAPVIMMTAYPTHAVREAARSLNIASLVVKPIDPRQLLDKVKALLRTRRSIERHGEDER